MFVDARDRSRDRSVQRNGDKTGCLGDNLPPINFVANFNDWFGGSADVLAQRKYDFIWKCDSFYRAAIGWRFVFGGVDAVTKALDLVQHDTGLQQGHRRPTANRRLIRGPLLWSFICSLAFCASLITLRDELAQRLLEKLGIPTIPA